ncbi:MAG: GNAT family N-acetyltransferase [Acidimicrobiales bacterium]
MSEGEADQLHGGTDRVVAAGEVEFAEADPEEPSARHCLSEYYKELDRRFPDGFDPSAGTPVSADAMRPPAGLFLLAMLNDSPIGCGGLRFHEHATTEINRLWIDPRVRGLGFGRRLLTELERRAAAKGSDAVCLDTNGTLDEAIAMYKSAGYVEVERFNENPFAQHWFRKDL